MSAYVTTVSGRVKVELTDQYQAVGPELAKAITARQPATKPKDEQK